MRFRYPSIRLHSPIYWWDEWSKAFSIRICFSLNALPTREKMAMRFERAKLAARKCVCLIVGHKIEDRNCVRCLKPFWIPLKKKS